jgi:hypothetical protein
MTVTDQRGITLNYSEPKSIYDRVIVMHCKAGQKPVQIGSIERDYDIVTESVQYQAYNQFHEPIGRPTDNWQDIEERFQKHAYIQSRSELQQAWLRMMNRSNDLRNIRKEKTTGQEINR